MKFQWVADHRGQWPLGVLCEVLGVSRSGYYAWRGRPESARRQRQRELVEEMHTIHKEPRKGCYGSPRMHKELLARGHEACENTVAQLMQNHELQATTQK